MPRLFQDLFTYIHRHADSRQPWAHFRPDQLASGLLGPVRLTGTPWVELRGREWGQGEIGAL